MTARLVKYSWDDETAAWLEDDLQAAQVNTLRRLGILHAADQNAARRSVRDGARRKTLGMAAGEPDLRIYLPTGRLLLIENKRKGGRLSDAQKERHADLRARGHDIETITAATPAAAVDGLLAHLELRRPWR